jgi:hypothetical protein
MTTKHAMAFATVLTLTALMAGCSSNDQSSSGKGKLAMSLGASGTTAAATTAGGVAADHGGGVTAANITISGASARTTDGTWVPLQGSFPMTVDLIALATSGNNVTFPPDIVPEGHYDAIQITITAVNLTLQDGTTVAITPPGTGWDVVIQVSFDVVAGQETVVHLKLRCDHSFHFLNGEFEFDPEIEVEAALQPLGAQWREARLHSQRHSRRAQAWIGNGQGIVEEDQDAIPSEAVDRAFVLRHEATHRVVEFPQHRFDLFRLGTVGEGRKATQIDEHVADFAAMRREDRFLSPGCYRLRDVRRKKVLELTQAIEFRDLGAHALFELYVPGLQRFRLQPDFVLERLDPQQGTDAGKKFGLVDGL